MKKVPATFESISLFAKEMDSKTIEHTCARTHTRTQKALIKTSKERKQAMKTKNQGGEINQSRHFVKMTSETEKEMNEGEGQKKGGGRVAWT